MRFRAAARAAIPVFCLLATHAAHAAQLIEDFSTDTFADHAASTGLWNTVGPCAGGGCAQAAVVADAAVSGTTRPISFGDGSDGVLSSSAGFTFDTNSHPNGYNFKSVSITGGAITVTGSNALVIRSLTTVNIAPTLAVDGTSGMIGAAAGVGSTSGGAGGSAVTCSANGGAGGNAAIAAGLPGNDGLQSDGSDEPSTAGAARNAATYDPTEEAGGPSDGPSPALSFDTAGAVICGAGGGGGGGYSDTVANFASGGGGGAGGGRVQITAVGNITFSVVTANGGNGGFAVVSGAAVCSGNGSAGNGGSVWLQSFNSMSNPATLNASAGAGGGPCNGHSGGSGLDGFTRADSSAGTVGAGGTSAASNTHLATADAAASQTYVVQSKAYDLGAANASFSSASVTSAANGGTVTVTYAGSTDGSTFSSFTTDITQLSSLDYRFLKFRVTLVTAGVAGVSPNVSRLVVNYTDLGIPGPPPPDSLNLKLSPGCGSIRRSGDSSSPPPSLGALARTFSPWLLFWLLAYGLLRGGRGQLQLVRSTSRAD